MQIKKGYWHNKFRNLKLAQKMIAIYVLIMGFCCLFSLVALRIAFNIYDDNLYQKSVQELDFFIQEVNQNLDQVEALSYYVAIDTKIQELLSHIKSVKHFTAEYTADIYNLRMLLNNELTNAGMISNIVYTDEESTQIVAGTSTGSPDPGGYEAFMETIHEARGAYVVQQPTKQYPYLLSGRDIRKHIDSSLEYLGTLLITSDVAGMIEKNINRLEAESSALCVYSDEGLIYENQEHMMDMVPQILGDKGYQIIRNNGQRYFLCHLKSAKTGWTYVNMFPYSEIYGQNQTLRNMMVAGFLALFAVSSLFLKKLAHMIVRPLEQLTQSMQIVETGDFKRARDYLGEDGRGDEIGLLTQEFKVSLDKIDHLIYENYEKQLLLKDTKYKMLQAQINPHFLYNTLNSIHWMVRARRNEEAADMTVALGEILRAALSSKQFFTMGEEINMLNKYIVIQKYRYQKRVDFQVDVNVTQSCLIPHMTLQPLVENAIYHAVEKMLTPCTIEVSVQEEGDQIRIEVRDNGPGMTQEELEAVRSFTVKPTGHGIGLKNIYERLKMAYDQMAVFKVESASGQGTAVKILIPRMEVEQPDV
ncbi:sensor histidine kinase [Enterocloster citroniae]|uniref:histidine kinase n=2 Tax=Enterocloster citroniae TaxID=358743 RepID=A0ABV2G3M9_9FIRM|nr:sensor histidine kinase [Enterocloster citroniae]KMW22490.1 hypothetical protein HMPREF9470_01369 [[Clostridium] citroniae WAL-19142]